MAFLLLVTFASHSRSMFPEAPHHPNIILITIGGLRSDHLGIFDGSHASAAIDGFVRKSIEYDNAYAQSPGTVVSHATILSGTYPQTNHASEFGSPLPSTLPYLPVSLHANGYHTAAIVGSTALDPLNGFSPGFDRGFDLYEAGSFFQSRANQKKMLADNPASAIISYSIRWMSKTPTPFFLWINLDEPSQARNSASYRRAISGVDGALGNLFEFLQRSHLLDDAAVILCADHGESLGAHGESGHGIFLYDETTHVPVFVKMPANKLAGKKIQVRVGLVDISPTLLEISGVAVPAGMEGQSLTRRAERDAGADLPVYARSDFPLQAFGWSPLESWRVGKYLYIRAPHPELYDLSNDPGASRNLAQKSPATVATIAAQLDEFDRRFELASGQSRSQLGSGDLQKLASLGYVGLQPARPNLRDQVTGIDPKDLIRVANQTLQAWFYLNNGDEMSASILFHAIIEAHPKNFLAQWGLGVTLAERHECPQAIEHLRIAIQLFPSFGWVYYQMGNCLDEMNNHEAAVIHLEIASHLSPENATFREKLLALERHSPAGQDHRFQFRP